MQQMIVDISQEHYLLIQQHFCLWYYLGVNPCFHSVPLHHINLKSDFASGQVVVGVRPTLPVEDISLLFGIDMAPIISEELRAHNCFPVFFLYHYLADNFTFILHSHIWRSPFSHQCIFFHEIASINILCFHY
jgi:hypothetical protein